MTDRTGGPVVAIVDFGMGNLFSVHEACERMGLASTITRSPETVLKADGVILPGVGAMPDAMRTLRESGLADALVQTAAEERPLLGICLGLQLLMSEGTEFEPHEGLGIIRGSVVRFEGTSPDGRRRKVPHVGWNTVQQPHERLDAWEGTPLAGIAAGTFMYFVHSYHVVPRDLDVVVARTEYGGAEFCSALRRRNVFGCQFHPERSGPQGLHMFKRFTSLVNTAERSRER